MKARSANRTGSVFFRLTVLSCCSWWLLSSTTGWAEERKFLLIKATMPRSFAPDGVPPVPPPGADDLNLIYFSEHDPSSVFSGGEDSDELGSFAEYWKEISYGIVRIQGKVLGTAELPWPQFPVVEDEPLVREPGDDIDQQAIDDLVDTFSPKPSENNEAYFDLNGDGFWQYGGGERVREDRVLYETDFNSTANAGDLNPQNAVADNSFQAADRFSEDVDDDGHLDLGVEDIDQDGRFDLSYEDLNENCVLDFASEDFVCGNRDGIYQVTDDCEGDDVDTPRWEDLDNDNNFDIGENPEDCPTGPFPWTVNPHTDWNADADFSRTEDLDGDGRHDIFPEDTNGNCVCDEFNDDDLCLDPTSFPFCNNPGDPCCPEIYAYDIANPFYPGEGVWTPGERFRDIDRDEYYDRFYEPCVNFNVPGGDMDVSNSFSDTNNTLRDGRDFIDGNNDDRRNFPEPLEDYMVMRVTNQPEVSQFAPVSPEYVINNYPGNVPFLLGRSGNKNYDSPDFWEDTEATDPTSTDDETDPRKLERDWLLPSVVGLSTPQPSWLYDVWSARYGVSAADHMVDDETGYGATMGWEPGGGIPNLVEYDPPDDSIFETVEVGFRANIGGTGGWGTVLEQMIHLHGFNGVLGIAEFTSVNCQGVLNLPPTDDCVNCKAYAFEDCPADCTPDEGNPDDPFDDICDFPEECPTYPAEDCPAAGCVVDDQGTPNDPADDTCEICAGAADGIPDDCGNDGVWGVIFDYNGTEFIYAYDTQWDERSLEEPLDVTEQNDYLFAVNDDGTAGCILRDSLEAVSTGTCQGSGLTCGSEDDCAVGSCLPMAPVSCFNDSDCADGEACTDNLCLPTDPASCSNNFDCNAGQFCDLVPFPCEGVGTWGCDYNMNGSTEELGVFGDATPYLPSGFICGEGNLQNLDMDDDEGCNDFMFDPCAWPGGNHPDCPNGPSGNPIAILGFPWTDPGLQLPPTMQTCLCIDFDVAVESGMPVSGDECDSGGMWIDPDGIGDPPDDTFPCFVPRCDSPYFPIPKYEEPAPADVSDCQTPFSKRYGDGTMIAPQPVESWPGYEEGGDDDPIRPPPTLVYDGPKEYDDLASSFYHTRWLQSADMEAPQVDVDGDGQADLGMVLQDYGGDQMIGEVITSDASVGVRNWYGHDRAAFGSQGDSFQGDNLIIPAGPMAGGDTGMDCSDPSAPDPQDRGCAVDFDGLLDQVHGGPGFDGGNVLNLELLTRRTDGIGISLPLAPECADDDDCPESSCNLNTNTCEIPAYGDPLDLSSHTNRTPDGRGFRDFNLDGLVDLGEGRAHGTENYSVSSDSFGSNDGMESPGDNYPFSRDRVTEDVMEHFDAAEDFDDWINDFAKCGGNSGPSAQISHMIVLPEALPSNRPFAVFSPGVIPINTIDEDDEKIVRLGNLLTPLTFTNLAASLDRNGESNEDVDSAGNFLVAFAAHEFGHYWECWPDLYDYDVFNGTLIEHPIARWDLMSGSSAGLVHVNPVFKENSGWIQGINLVTKLIPGVPQEIRLDPIEAVGDSYYYFENPDPQLRECPDLSNPLDARCRVERFYFFHLHDHGEFSSLLPWDGPRGGGGSPLGAFDMSCPPENDSGPFKDGGMMLLHADLAANSEAIPLQQRFDTHFSYLYVQADGQHSLEELFGAGGNTGDAGDPWPGYCNITEWNLATNPNNTWWRFSNNDGSGIEITDIIDELSGTNVTMLWFPQDIPTMQFIQPPGGQSISQEYPISYRWDDLYGGTGLTLFVQRDNPGDSLEVNQLGICLADCYSGTAINNSAANPIGKPTSGNNFATELMPMSDFPGLEDGDGFYRFFGFLDPAAYSPGIDGGCENAATPGLDRSCAVEDYQGIAAFENVGQGTLDIEIIKASPLDPDSIRLEGWQVTHVGGNEWEVCGSISGLQVPAGGPYITCAQAEGYNGPRHLLTTGQQDWETTSPPGAFGLMLAQIGDEFGVGDYFSFATTGFTAYSEPVEVIKNEIDPGPEAIIVVSSQQEPCCFPGVNIFFDGTTSVDSEGNTGGLIAYEWEFDTDGDGEPDETKAGPTANQDYAAAGEYLVRLTVTEGPPSSRQDSEEKIIVVNNSKPVADFVATPDAGPVPLPVNLDASDSFDPDGNIVQYLWKFKCADAECSDLLADPDRATANPVIDHLFGEEDSYFVGLKVVDDDGEVSENTAVHTIHAGNQPPIAALTATPTRINAGDTVIFDAGDSSDPDGDPLIFVFDFGDGTMLDPGSEALVTHRYTQVNPLGWNAKVKVFDNEDLNEAGSDETTEKIIVELGSGNTISVNISASPDKGVSPLRVSFVGTATDTQGEQLVYRWVFDDNGTIGFGPTVSHTYENKDVAGASKSFNPILIVSDPNGAQGSDMMTIEVFPTELAPEEDETITAVFRLTPDSEGTGVAPHSVQFDTAGSNAADGSPVTVNVDCGNELPIQTTLPGVLVGCTYSIAGIYEASATVLAKGDPGEPDRIRQATNIRITVLASEPPVAQLDASPRGGDAPLEVNFDAGASSDPENQPLSYVWDFDDGTPLGTTAFVRHTFNSPGEYEVELTVTDVTGGSATEIVLITVTSAGTGGMVGTPLPPPQTGPGGGGIGDGTIPCGGCGAMGAGQLLLLLVGLVGLKLRGRNRRRL